MASKSGSLNYWRRFFRSTEADIFEVIEQAIVVAAVDCPKEFRSRRDRIAEKLFSCRVSRCFGCNNVELLVPDTGEELRVEEGGASVKREVVEKDSKVDSCTGEHDEITKAQLSNYSYDEAEALTDVMDEQNRITKEVLRLKEVLCHSHDKTDTVLYESLRLLQVMQISVETLRATEIGRTVNDLRKHESKQIGRLSRTLIQGWKEMVDEWVQSAAAISERRPDSVNPAPVDEEEGLPSPPMDEGALLATQDTSIQLSEIFDGIDDDGNFRVPCNNENSVLESRGHARWTGPPRRPAVVPKPLPAPVPKPLPAPVPKPLTAPFVQPKPQDAANKVDKPSIQTSGPGRPPVKPNHEQKPINQVSAVQRTAPNIPLDKSKNDEEALYKAKLELAKRKLHDGYEQAESAKRQRTIQLVEFQELPKQPGNQRGKSNNQRGPNAKPKSQGRNQVIARR